MLTRTPDVHRFLGPHRGFGVSEPGFYFEAGGCGVMEGPYKSENMAYRSLMAHRKAERETRRTVWYYGSRLLDGGSRTGGPGYYYECGVDSGEVEGPYLTEALAQKAADAHR